MTANPATVDSIVCSALFRNFRLETLMTPLKLLFTAALIASVGGVAAKAPNDAQIASIVVVANQVDIDAGHLAESKASSTDVKSFAKQMITDHTGVNKQAVALVTRLGVTPQDNPTSQSLKKGGEDNMKSLKLLKGTAFDKAYIDHEVTYHQQVLDEIDKTLIPSAQNPELKALLLAVRPAFVGHLEHAKQVQSNLGKK
jgi:putative membrane protein